MEFTGIPGINYTDLPRNMRSGAPSRYPACSCLGSRLSPGSSGAESKKAASSITQGSRADTPLELITQHCIERHIPGGSFCILTVDIQEAQVITQTDTEVVSSIKETAY